VRTIAPPTINRIKKKRIREDYTSRTLHACTSHLRAGAQASLSAVAIGTFLADGEQHVHAPAGRVDSGVMTGR
jgi:hypothetical protein